MTGALTATGGATPQAAGKRLRAAYVVGLGLIAILSLSAYRIVEAALATARSDSAVINVAGRQRMLSQRIAKTAAALDLPGATARRAELAQALDEWQRAHYGLVRGDRGLGLPGFADDDPIRDAFSVLDPLVTSVSENARRLAMGSDDPEQVRSVIENADRFLPAMNSLVDRMETRARARVDALATLELWLVIVTLSVLVLEAVLVFEPAAKTITDQIRRLRELRREAESAKEAKGAFLANVSHEIRTPMTAILGFADLLRDPASTTAETEEAIQTIRRNGDHLLGLINDILDVSKIESGELRVERLRTDLRAVVRDALAICEPKAKEKRTALVFDLDGSIPESIVSDPLRLRQCLINLVANAVRFTPEGTVRVTLRADESTGTVVFDVADNGCGIASEHLDSIFRPFEQEDVSVSRSYGGTGLGLTITRALAEKLGGRLAVSSEVGVGSTFQMTIPTGEVTTGWVRSPHTDALPKGRSTATEATDENPIRLRGRVLVVDDTSDNRALVRKVLERAGAQVDLAENGMVGREMALRRMREGETYSLVLMDVQMPILDGYAATEQLRKAGYDGTIVALTANTQGSEFERARGAGCDGHLGKPIRPHALVREVEAWMTRGRARPPEQRI